MSKRTGQQGHGVGGVEKQKRAAEHRKKRDQDLGNASIRGITSAINSVADQLSSGEKAQTITENKRRFRENLTLWLLGFTFLAAGIGDVFFGFQLAAMKALNSESRYALVQSQRAYLFPDHPIQAENVDPKSKLINVMLYQPQFQNYGNTPALKVTCWANIAESIEKFRDRGANPRRSYDVGPHEPAIGCGQLRITQSELIGIWNKTMNRYIAARVDYADVFDKTPPRFTEYCVQVQVVGDPRQRVKDMNHVPSIVLYPAAAQECNGSN